MCMYILKGRDSNGCFNTRAAFREQAHLRYGGRRNGEGGRGKKRREQFELVYSTIHRPVASPGIFQNYSTALGNQPFIPLIVHHGRQLGSHSPAETNPYKWKEGGFVFTGIHYGGELSQLTNRTHHKNFERKPLAF